MPVITYACDNLRSGVQTIPPFSTIGQRSQPAVGMGGLKMSRNSSGCVLAVLVHTGAGPAGQHFSYCTPSTLWALHSSLMNVCRPCM